MKIELYDLLQTALIIPAPTGIEYLNQVGGTACFQKSVEGALWPIEFEFELNAREKSLSSQLEQLFTHGTGFISKNDAEKVQILLQSQKSTSFVSVDFDKLDYSCEARVFVELNNKVKAILTWPNSD